MSLLCRSCSSRVQTWRRQLSAHGCSPLNSGLVVACPLCATTGAEWFGVQKTAFVPQLQRSGSVSGGFFLGPVHWFRAGGRVYRDTAPIIRCISCGVMDKHFFVCFLSAPQTPQEHEHSRDPCLCACLFPCLLWRLAMSMAGLAGGAARRRRERQLRSFLRHEELSVKMAPTRALHHSVQRVEAPSEREWSTRRTSAYGHRSLHSRGSALVSRRSQRRRWRAVTVSHVAAPGPLLSTPLLADTAADTVDARTVKYLLHAQEEGGGGGGGEEEGEGGEAARGDCVACCADCAQDPGPATQNHDAL